MTTATGGRTAKPRALRILHGDRTDRIRDDEPTPAAGEPAMPADLTPAARLVWDELAPQLSRMGVLTIADGLALACFAESVAVLRRCTQLLAGSDVLLRSSQDRPIRNPALIAQRDAMRTTLYWAREFGLTPASRHGVAIAGVPLDERETLLS